MADGSSPTPTFSWLPIWLVLGLLVIAISVPTAMRGKGSQPVNPQSTDWKPIPLSPIQTGDRSNNAESEVGHATKFVTTIRRPDGPPVIELDRTDPQGRRGSVACSTCHSVRDPNYSNRTPADLDQFHQNMPMAHGTLACYSCHNPSDTDTLRLADSTSVEYPDVMTLCAQCHGSQARDYKHGAHGGMNGYWDLSRGPRTRNNCIDCHDPHVPKFPMMQPTFKPRDRFLEPPKEHDNTSHRATSIGHSLSEGNGG